MYCICVCTMVIYLWELGCFVDFTQFLIPCLKSRSSGGMDDYQHCQIKLLAEGSSKATIDGNRTVATIFQLQGWRLIHSAAKPWQHVMAWLWKSGRWGWDEDVLGLLRLRWGCITEAEIRMYYWGWDEDVRIGLKTEWRILWSQVSRSGTFLNHTN